MRAKLKSFWLSLLIASFLGAISAPAHAATLTTCGGSGSTNRLDPPLNPNGDLAAGMNFSALPLTDVKASKASATSAYATWGDWNPGPGLITYFMYASSNNGNSWSCTRSYAHSAQIDGLTAGAEFLVAVMARSGDTWAKPVIIRVSAATVANQKCAPPGYRLSAEYVSALGAFKVVVTSDSYSDDSVYFVYTFEASTDGWKTKTIARGGNFSPTEFMSPYLAWIKPISKTATHQFRAIPSINTRLAPTGADGKPLYTTTGCPNLLTSAGFTSAKADPCATNALASGCESTLVAGENADASTVIPTPKATVKVTKSINCYLGKTKAVISGTSPKCPTGWKKK